VPKPVRSRANAAFDVRNKKASAGVERRLGRLPSR
jgi:hypothetical protein